MNVRTSVTEGVLGIRDLEHPWLFYVLVFGVSLFLIGVVANALGRPTWAGFLAIYSVIATFAAVFGYVLILLFRLAAEWS